MERRLWQISMIGQITGKRDEHTMIQDSNNNQAKQEKNEQNNR